MALTKVKGAVWDSEDNGLSVNVRDYGAVGDGVTDDTAAIQAAIDYAETIFVSGIYGQGAKVCFPAGVYLISSTLTINQHGVSLCGDGLSATVILNNSNINTIYFGLANPEDNNLIEGVGVSDMTIWNKLADNSASIGIKLDRAAQSWIDNVQVRDHWTGITVEGTGESVRITNVNVSSGSRNTALQTGSKGIYITRREVNASDPNGVQDANDSLYYTEPNSVYLSNINIRSFSGYGMDHNLWIGACDGIYLTNSHIGFGVTSCIHIQAQQANLGLGNIQATGVFVDPAPGVSSYGIFYNTNGTISSNFMQKHFWTNCIIDGADINALRIKTEDADKPQSVKFTGCEFRSSVQNNVFIDSGRWVGFSNCDFRDTTVTDILLHQIEDIRIVGCTFSSGFRALQTSDSPAVAQVTFANNYIDGASNGRSMLLAHADQNDKISNNITTLSTSVASASEIAPDLCHDTFHITGTTTINTIKSSTSGNGKVSFHGRVIKLIFDGILTFTHNSGAAGMLLKSGGDLTTAANDVITLVYDETLDKWLEV